MYISSIAITFYSERDSSLFATTVSLDYVVGCTILHAMNFLDRNPIVKSYLKNGYFIINLIFKYSKL